MTCLPFGFVPGRSGVRELGQLGFDGPRSDIGHVEIALGVQQVGSDQMRVVAAVLLELAEQALNDRIASGRLNQRRRGCARALSGAGAA